MSNPHERYWHFPASHTNKFCTLLWEVTEPMLELSEASTGFDIANLQPFLERIAPLIASGFGLAEIDLILDGATHMELDEEIEWEIPITYAGQQTVLRVGLFRDDLHDFDLYLYALPELAELFLQEMERYSEALEDANFSQQVIAFDDEELEVE